MEFRFNVSKIFKNNISRIGNSLLPAGYVAADRRSALDTTMYVAEIINSIGNASAKAQGLSQPVTTSDRLRNSDDQVIYLLTEDNDKNGLVVGLLKIGRKSLYVFDKFGETRHVNAPSVLDFYIHESRQRGGLGKIIFEYMLEYENLLPEQLAIDRPSDKLLGFLRKHYALTQKIPQMNNFVIFDGFFAPEQSNNEVNGSAPVHITASPNSNFFGPQPVSAKHRSNSRSRQEPPKNLQNHVIGRYGAPRPHCSLNEIIHNKPTSVTSEPNSKLNSEGASEKTEKIDKGATEVDQLAQEIETLEVKAEDPPASLSPPSTTDHVKFADDQIDSMSNGSGYYHHEPEYFHDPEPQPDYFRAKRSSSPFQYSKRQTGKKNISNISVGNDKTDFSPRYNQIDDRAYGGNNLIGVPTSNAYEPEDNDSMYSRGSEQNRTADGFFDLKFYSHPLW